MSLKGGVCYVAQTLKLAPGIDTNLIVYGSQRDAAPAWAGNDDVATGVLESHARFCVPHRLGSIIGYLDLLKHKHVLLTKETIEKLAEVVKA